MEVAALEGILVRKTSRFSRVVAMYSWIPNCFGISKFKAAAMCDRDKSVAPYSRCARDNSARAAMFL